MPPLLLLLLLLLLLSVSSLPSFNLGYLYIHSASSWVAESFSQFKLAIYTVNDNPDFPFTFTYDAYDTRGSQNAALAGAIKLLSNSSTIGLIGTGYSSALEAPAMYSSLRSKPMVSPGSTSIAATTKSQFPCLLRSISSDAAQIKFLAATLAKLSISNVAVLTPDDSYGRSLLPQIVSYYATANINIRTSPTYTPSQTTTTAVRSIKSITLALSSVKLSGAKVIICHSLTADFVNVVAGEKTSETKNDARDEQDDAEGDMRKQLPPRVVTGCLNCDELMANVCELCEHRREGAR